MNQYGQTLRAKRKRCGPSQTSHQAALQIRYISVIKSPAFNKTPECISYTIICSRIWPKVEFQTLGSLVMKFSENTQQNCREHNQEWTKLEKIRKRLNNATAS